MVLQTVDVDGHPGLFTLPDFEGQNMVKRLSWNSSYKRTLKSDEHESKSENNFLSFAVES